MSIQCRVNCRYTNSKLGRRSWSSRNSRDVQVSSRPKLASGSWQAGCCLHVSSEYTFLFAPYKSRSNSLAAMSLPLTVTTG